MRSNPKWLENAVFYEIYPQTFCDSNADGIGDIPGITQKLPYLKSLGVTALWLNPCFESPFQDAGYDVSDYCKVAARYGTNEDLRTLFAEAGKLGLRVLLDLVPGHTSTEHPWFQESCKHTPNQYTDHYVWTDSAWSWNVTGVKTVSGYAERNAAYVTNFFYFQPALNYGFAHPDPQSPWQQAVDAPGPRAVREEMRKVMRFWLDMGASGFRVDMAGSLVKNDPGWQATAALWGEMREWLEREFPEAVLVAEWSQPQVSLKAGFHMDFLLHFGSFGYMALLRKPFGRGHGQDPYGFSFFDRSGHGNIREFIDEYLERYAVSKDYGHIAIATGNHDVRPRISEGRNADDLAVIYLWQLTMPGTPFIYYGDEIGMRTVHGLPSKEGAYERTGSRTPMQWNDETNAGFSTAPVEALYLPVDPVPNRPTVAAQESDPNSLLNRVRRLIALRQAYPALQASADFKVLYAEAGRCPFVYLREKDGQWIMVAVNPAAAPVEVELPLALNAVPTTLYGIADAVAVEGDKAVIRLPGVSGGVYLI